MTKRPDTSCRCRAARVAAVSSLAAFLLLIPRLPAAQGAPPAGTLDTTFGTGGKILTDFGSALALVQAVAITERDTATIYQAFGRGSTVCSAIVSGHALQLSHPLEGNRLLKCGCEARPTKGAGCEEFEWLSSVESDETVGSASPLRSY